MRVYLDNCCFNRPFDDQSQLRIRLEAEAKLLIQEKISRGDIEVVWSYMLEYENSANPFEERRTAIDRWKTQATLDIGADPKVLEVSKRFRERGLKSKDAIHAACASAARADYFVTTDDDILDALEDCEDLRAIDPLNLIRLIQS